MIPCPARVSPYNTPHGAAGMPPSLICTRICPPPATEGPPPGGGPSVRFKRRLNNHSTFLGTILRVTILVFPSTMEILCLTGQKCSENRKRGVSYEEGSWNEQTASCAGRAQRWNSGKQGLVRRGQAPLLAQALLEGTHGLLSPQPLSWCAQGKPPAQPEAFLCLSAQRDGLSSRPAGRSHGAWGRWRRW